MYQSSRYNQEYNKIYNRPQLPQQKRGDSLHTNRSRGRLPPRGPHSDTATSPPDPLTTGDPNKSWSAGREHWSMGRGKFLIGIDQIPYAADTIHFFPYDDVCLYFNLSCSIFY